MRKLLTAMACAAALCLGSAAQAAVLNFDDPGVIDIDPMTGIATYTESGFTISGPAASFLTLGGQLVGTDPPTPIALKALSGGRFSLLALDYAFFDLGGAPAPGMLLISGILDGMTVTTQLLSLGDAASFTFGASWRGLTEVDFQGSLGFALDNISLVPEPGTLLLANGALLLLALGARRRPERR